MHGKDSEVKASKKGKEMAANIWEYLFATDTPSSGFFFSFPGEAQNLGYGDSIFVSRSQLTPLISEDEYPCNCIGGACSESGLFSMPCVTKILTELLGVG